MITLFIATIIKLILLSNHVGLSQYDVAEKLGTTQSAVSKWEAQGSKPHKKTRERLAALYNCKPEQMTP
ncbi:XRE family transcriptional regulator [Hafnia paralvei]|nr:XRE family transcriptional regulator [Hafnia paralvei]